MGEQFVDEFYKEHKNSRMYWVDRKYLDGDEMVTATGEHLFSFDKKKVYNLFEDYPHALTKEEKEIFDSENPFWVDFFQDRQ